MSLKFVGEVIGEIADDFGVRRWIWSIIFVAVGWIVAQYSMPGEYYESLNKPDYIPPNWVFGVVWTALYILLGLIFYNYTSKQKRNTLVPIAVFMSQMVLNYSWSFVFFTLQQPFAALFIIGAMIILSIYWVGLTLLKVESAALPMLLYIAWLFFAFDLNWNIYQLN